MTSRCETCKFCKWAESRPETVIGKIWKWHTGWCPCWKAYQEDLAKRGDCPPHEKSS